MIRKNPHYEMLTASMFVGVQTKFPIAESKAAPAGRSYTSVKLTASPSTSVVVTFSFTSSPSVAFSIVRVTIVGLWFAETCSVPCDNAYISLFSYNWQVSSNVAYFLALILLDLNMIAFANIKTLQHECRMYQ